MSRVENGLLEQSTQQIYKSINGIISDIGAIGKDKKNQAQGFKYRGVDDVMNNLQPLLAKYQVCIVPNVLDHKRELLENKSGGKNIYSIMQIRYDFVAVDGSTISATVIGEAMDNSDKASNKAMSVGFKYACFMVFCIPTEELKDPDADSPAHGNSTPTQSAQQVKPNFAPPTEKQLAYLQQHNITLQQIATKYKCKVEQLDEQMVKAVCQQHYDNMQKANKALEDSGL